MLGANDPSSCIFDLNHGIRQISFADMLESRAEEFPLPNWRHAGNNNDHTGVQRFLAVQNEKIGTIVGYKRIVLRADCGHELQIFGAAEPEIIDVICQMTCEVCYS